MAKKSKAGDMSDSVPHIPARAPKRPADGDQKGNPEMTSLPDGTPGQKKAMIEDMASVLAQMTEEEVEALHSAMLGEAGEKKFAIPVQDHDEPDGDEGDDEGDEDEDDEGEKKGKEDVQINIKKEDLDLAPHLAALTKVFEGTEIKPEFQDKFKTIFETAIVDALNQFAPWRSEIVAEAAEQLVGDLDGYLRSQVEEWADKNALAIEQSARVDIAESFLSGLHQLFAEHYVDVPEDKRDVVEEIAKEYDDLAEAYDAQAEQLAETQSALEGLMRDMIVRSECADLTEQQIDKLTELSEGVSFDDPDTFSERVKTLRENYLGGKSGTTLVEHNDTVEQATEKKTEVPAIMSEALVRMSPYRSRQRPNSK